jgi:hypothetical protein
MPDRRLIEQINRETGYFVDFVKGFPSLLSRSVNCAYVFEFRRAAARGAKFSFFFN